MCRLPTCIFALILLSSGMAIQQLHAQEQEEGGYPCRTRSEAHAFDFWIGTWNVTVKGKKAGVNEIYPILGHCVIFENWTNVKGRAGKSFNYFNADTGKWRQIWVSDSGNVLEYTGSFREGAMRFEGMTFNADGDTTLQKLTFYPVAADTVRQVFEASTDGGATWETTFDGLYVRQK